MAGKPVDVADAWIAATAALLDARRVTHNRRHFENIEDLELISVLTGSSSRLSASLSFSPAPNECWHCYPLLPSVIESHLVLRGVSPLIAREEFSLWGLRRASI